MKKFQNVNNYTVFEKNFLWLHLSESFHVLSIEKKNLRNYICTNYFFDPVRGNKFAGKLCFHQPRKQFPQNPLSTGMLAWWQKIFFRLMFFSFWPLSKTYSYCIKNIKRSKFTKNFADNLHTQEFLPPKIFGNKVLRCTNTLSLNKHLS